MTYVTVRHEPPPPPGPPPLNPTPTALPTPPPNTPRLRRHIHKKEAEQGGKPLSPASSPGGKKTHKQDNTGGEKKPQTRSPRIIIAGT